MHNQPLAGTHEVARLLPYSPTLRHLLKSYGASLLLIYLERQEQDSFVLDVRRTSVLFHISRGVFMLHLWMLAVGWRSQRLHLVARKAGREFFTKTTRGAGALKPYCYVRLDADRVEIHRNKPRTQQLLAQAGLIEGGMCHTDGGGMDGYTPRLLSFAQQIRADAKQFASQVVDPMNDGRSRPGIKRKAHTRRPWTEERRAKRAATMAARSVGKSFSSEPPNE